MFPDNTLPEVTQNESLRPYNTLGIDARASTFASVATEDQLKKLLGDPTYNQAKRFILGGGSNVLFAGDYEGLIIHVAIKGMEKVREDEKHVWVRSGAGENWHELVLYCVEKGWGGIENLSLIPGTVGAAPIQNIGAYGVELEEVFDSLEAVETESLETKRFSKADCRFGYRESVFKNELRGKYIITNVTLRLSKDPVINSSYGAIRTLLEDRGIDNPGIRDISDAVISIRRSKLPNPEELGNAGSFFKNPVVSPETYDKLKQDYPSMPGYTLENGEVKVPAGWLIEKAGWKGKRVGRAGTYRQQALVIVNHGGATAEEIIGLSERIRKSIADRFGISLTPEVNIIV